MNVAHSFYPLIFLRITSNNLHHGILSMMEEREWQRESEREPFHWYIERNNSHVANVWTVRLYVRMKQMSKSNRTKKSLWTVFDMGSIRSHRQYINRVVESTFCAPVFFADCLSYSAISATHNVKVIQVQWITWQCHEVVGQGFLCFFFHFPNTNTQKR